MMSMTSFQCFLLTLNTPFSTVSIVDFEMFAGIEGSVDFYMSEVIVSNTKYPIC